MAKVYTDSAGVPMGSSAAPPPVYSAESAAEAGFDDAFDAFSEKNVRRSFIRKVYSILGTQLLITLAFVMAFTYIPNTDKFVISTPGLSLMIISAIGTFIICIMLSCCRSHARTSPNNMILMVTFTIMESYLVGSICALTDKETVLMAIAITAAIVIGITIFAFQTKYDFTIFGGFVTGSMFALLIMGFFLGFSHVPVLHTIMAAIGLMLFSFYLLYHTQQLMDDKSCQISPEDYILAVLILYLDIINIFIRVLILLGGRR